MYIIQYDFQQESTRTTKTPIQKSLQQDNNTVASDFKSEANHVRPSKGITSSGTKRLAFKCQTNHSLTTRNLNEVKNRKHTFVEKNFTVLKTSCFT